MVGAPGISFFLFHCYPQYPMPLLSPTPTPVHSLLLPLSPLLPSILYSILFHHYFPLLILSPFYTFSTRCLVLPLLTPLFSTSSSRAVTTHHTLFSTHTTTTTSTTTAPPPTVSSQCLLFSLFVSTHSVLLLSSFPPSADSACK